MEEDREICLMDDQGGEEEVVIPDEGVMLVIRRALNV